MGCEERKTRAGCEGRSDELRRRCVLEYDVYLGSLDSSFTSFARRSPERLDGAAGVSSQRDPSNHSR